MNDIVKNALNWFERDATHWGNIYLKASEDLHFLSDDKYAQWDQKDFDARTNSGRPALTVDQLSQFVHQVSNDIRQNTPTFTVIPDDQESSEEDAEGFRAIIRGIEYKSNADDVYDTAANNAVKCSIGFIRIDHDYCDSENGFEQELQIKRVINPLSVFLDSDSIECDGRDAKRGLVIDKMKVSAFKAKYPGKQPVSFDPQGLAKGLRPKDDEEIQYAELFVLEDEEKLIAMDSQGNVFDYKEGSPFEAKRSVKTSKVKRYKLSGSDVLEETSFPGKYIPLIPVYGEEHWQDGKRHLFSLIRKAKGAQMMYNVWKSLETEIILKQPNAPVMVAEGSIEDYADDWKDPQKSMALRYKTEVDGKPVPPPQRLSPPTVPAGIINAAREAVEDIKSSMGLYNAAIGQRGSATSGKQEIAQQKEGDVATFHFYDNLVRSITHVYRVLISAIPEIYDTSRVIRAVGKEEEPVSLGINGAVAEGQEQTLDLSKGKYSVRVVPGASYTTRRQEAAAFYTDVVTKMPELMNVMGDLVFKYSDMEGSEAMADRMKKVIDPKFLEEDEQVAPDPEKLQMQQVIEQGAQQLQALQEQLTVQDTQAKLEKQLEQLKAEKQILSMSEQLARLQIENMKKDLTIEKLQAQNEIKAQIQEAEDAVDEALGGDEEIPANELAQG